MPTDISNALGTARQFTPQPDALYQPRLSGVAAIQQGVASITNHELAAANLSKIMNTLNAYGLSRERRRDEWALEVGKRVINATDAESMLTLDVIDGAQTAGYADVAHDPYFIAHAERLRGEFLATKARQVYDEKYAELPAKNVDEEVQRWNEFRRDWLKNNIKTDSLNSVAFNKGFNESGMVNQSNIASEYTKKQIDEAMKVTYAETKSQLALVSEQAGELLKENGAMTAKVQQIFNNPRLAGMPLQYRVAIAQEFVDTLVATGRITGERALQMMDKVTIQTSMDGTRKVLSDVCDTFSIKTRAENYQNKYFTEQKYSILEEYKSDPDMSRFYTDWENCEDPVKKQAMGQMSSSLYGAQEANKKSKEKAAAAQSKLAADAAAANFYLETNFQAYKDGKEFDASDLYNKSGMPLIAVPNKKPREATKEELSSFLKTKLIEAFTSKKPAEERVKDWMNVLDYPPLRSFKQEYISEYKKTLTEMTPDTLKRDEDGKAVVPDVAHMLVDAYTMDAPLFRNAFGKELSQYVARLNRYASNAGSLEEGYERLAADNALDLDTEVKQRYEMEISNDIYASTSGYNIEDMHTAGGGPVTTAWLAGNAELSTAVEHQAVYYRAQGYNVKDALNLGMGDIKKHNMYYHGAILPKNLFSKAGTGNDEYWAVQELDGYIYDVAAKSGDVKDAEHVNVMYNEDTNSLCFSYNGIVKYVPVSSIKEGAYKRAKAAQQNGTKPPNNITADEINTARTEGTSVDDGMLDVYSIQDDLGVD